MSLEYPGSQTQAQLISVSHIVSLRLGFWVSMQVTSVYLHGPNGESLFPKANLPLKEDLMPLGEVKQSEAIVGHRAPFQSNPVFESAGGQPVRSS